MRVTSRPSALAAAAAGCAGAVAVAACGPSSAAAHSAQDNHARKARSVTAGGSAPGGGTASTVRSVHVSSDTGSITVKGTSGPVVTGERAGNSMVPAPHKLSGGTLTVGSPDGNHSYYLEVPKSAAVDATAAHGAIQLASLAGQLQATAASGTVSGQRLSAGNATFSSHTGGIDASFTAPPKNVAATAQTGSVILRVPRGASYAVNAHSGRGASQVMVARAASAQHAVTATAGSGPVLVMPI